MVVVQLWLWFHRAKLAVQGLFQTLIIHFKFPKRSRILRHIMVELESSRNMYKFSHSWKEQNICAFSFNSRRGRHAAETTRGILLPWTSWFRNFCYVTLSDSAALTADEECTQLKESWICTMVSICFHFDPQNPHWKHTAPAKTIFETSAYEWMLQLTNTFSFL